LLRRIDCADAGWEKECLGQEEFTVTWTREDCVDEGHNPIKLKCRVDIYEETSGDYVRKHLGGDRDWCYWTIFDNWWAME